MLRLIFLGIVFIMLSFHLHRFTVKPQELGLGSHSHFHIFSFIPSPSVWKQLSTPVKHMIITNTLFSLGGSLGSMFLGIYILRELNNNINQIALFALAQFPTILLGYLLGALTRSNRKASDSMRVGIILQIIGFALLIILRENALNYLIPFGLLFGLVIGLYWTGNNLLIYFHTKNANRDGYFATNFSITSILSVIIPLISAIIINQTILPYKNMTDNYYYLFFAAIVVLSFAYYATYKLPNDLIPKVSINKLLEPLHSKVWRMVSIALIVENIKVGSEGFISSFLLFYIFQSELSIGTYQSFFALISALFALKLAKKIKPNNRIKSLLIGSCLILIAQIIYIQLFSVWGILICSIILIFASPLYNIGTSSVLLDAVDYSQDPNHNPNQFIIFREIPMLIGRSFGVIAFLIFARLGNNLEAAKFWFLLLGFVPLIYGLLIYQFEKMIKEENGELANNIAFAD